MATHYVSPLEKSRCVHSCVSRDAAFNAVDTLVECAQNIFGASVTADIFTLGQFATAQLTPNLAGTGALVYDVTANQFKGRFASEWKNLASAGAAGLGPPGAIQLSDGSGSLVFNPLVRTEVTSNTENPVSRLVVDASTTPVKPLGPAFEPNARLRLVPAPTQVTFATVPPLDGDIAYFNDSLLNGKDLYFYKGTHWVSLTGAGSPSTAAGVQYAVQINATGGATPQLGGSSDFLFDTSGASNALTLNADSTLTGTSLFAGDVNITTAGSATIAQFNAAHGVQMQTNASARGIDLRSLASAPMLLRTASADLALASTAANIALDVVAGSTITTTAGNVVAELKDAGSNGEFWTMSSNFAGDPTPDFGVRLRDDATYLRGVGASLYLAGGSGINTPRMGTLELNTLNGSASLTRVFLQSQTGSSAGASGGGYRALFGGGSFSSGSAPTPSNLGSGQTLQMGQFYVGEARAGTRPHINYNLSSNTPAGLLGFGTFNFAETTLNVCNAAETTRYVSAGKGIDSGVLYGGNVSLYRATGNVAEVQLRGDGLATFGVQSSTPLVRLDGTATGSGAGGLVTVENAAYQSLSSSPANPIKLDARGAAPEIVVGTANILSGVAGTLRITEGFRDAIVADGGANGVGSFYGTVTVGTAANSSTTLLGGSNSSSTGLRSIKAPGSLLANGIMHVSYGTWSGQGYDQRADLCLGGTPEVIPDTGQPVAGENNPNFMIRTQKRGSGTETYPALILNRYLGPASATVSERMLQGVMYLNRSREGGAAFKNRVQIATGNPYPSANYMVNLVCKEPTAASPLPQGAAIPDPFPISTPRDPDDGICLNGDVVINRFRGITFDAANYTGSGWQDAQGPLFIGKVNNLASPGGLVNGQKSNTISTTFTTGVHIGADFGGTTPAGNNNTGCTVNGDVRVGNDASMNVVHGGAKTHTGYVGDGGLFATNETGLRGSSVYTNILGIGGTKLYMAKNTAPEAGDVFVVCSCVEGPQGMVILRGQVALLANVFQCQVDLDSTAATDATTIVPHNNPDHPWPRGTFAAMFQNPTVMVTNAGVLAGPATYPATPVIDPDPNWTQVRGQIQINPTTRESTLLLQTNGSVQNLTLNYVVYCERRDVGYTGAVGYPGFTKPYANPVTGTLVTFSGTATAAEIAANGGGDIGL